MDGKALGGLAMTKRVALILAFGASLFSFSVHASPIPVAPMRSAPDIILVWDWCGLGFHRSVYGYCIRNGTVAAPPVVVPAPVEVVPAPVEVVPAPVVVEPLPVVVPLVCPSGYYLGPYGRCLLSY